MFELPELRRAGLVRQDATARAQSSLIPPSSGGVVAGSGASSCPAASPSARSASHRRLPAVVLPMVLTTTTPVSITNALNLRAELIIDTSIVSLAGTSSPGTLVESLWMGWG